MPPPSSYERRAQPRRAARIVVSVSADGREFLAYTHNVSGSGAFLSCEEPLADGSMLSLRFSVPTDPEPISVGAEVRWVARDAGGRVTGVGVRMGGMRAREMRAWALFVRTLE